MDPERQWIAHLEPETPEDREEELAEAPLSRVPRLIGGGVVAVGGGLGLIGALDEDLTILRLAGLAVAAAAALIVTLLRRRHAQLAES
jgi:hypothetical protein